MCVCSVYVVCEHVVFGVFIDYIRPMDTKLWRAPVDL